MRERIRTAFLFSDHNVDVDLVLGRDCLLHPLSRPFVVANQFTQNNVAHGETERGHRNCAVAELRDQIVVAAAAGDSAKFSGAIENFEDDPGVIRESANNAYIDNDEIGQPPIAQTVDKLLKFFAFAAIAQNGEHRIGQLAKFRSRILRRLASGLVDDLEQFVPPIRRNAFPAQEIRPKFPIADPDNDIFFCETESAQEVNAKGEHLDVRGERALPNNVAIELKVFAQAAALLLFVAKKPADGEPFQGLLEFAFVGGNHASQRRRELGTHRHFALAFVGEIKKLVNDFGAALFFIQFSGFEDRAIPFHKAITLGNFAPAREDVVTRCAVLG